MLKMAFSIKCIDNVTCLYSQIHYGKAVEVQEPDIDFSFFNAAEVLLSGMYAHVSFFPEVQHKIIVRTNRLHLVALPGFFLVQNDCTDSEKSVVGLNLFLHANHFYFSSRICFLYSSKLNGSLGTGTPVISSARFKLSPVCASFTQPSKIEAKAKRFL